MRIKISFLGWIALIVAVQASACKTTELATKDTEATDSQRVKAVAYKQPGKKQVMNVFLNASTGKNNTVLFSAKNIIVSNGYYKNTIALDKQGADQFKAIFTNENGVAIDSSYFDNPLKKHIEYVNDNGKLTHGTIEQPAETAYTRVNYNTAIARMEIYDIKNKKVKVLDLKDLIKK